MKNVVNAFAPANISCIFKVLKNNNPEKSGSIGLGFTLNYGVIVEVSFSDKTEIFFNGKKINFPTVEYVISKLQFNSCVRVLITSLLPIGCGFGLSGASALAVSLSLNKLFNLKKENLELAKIAHVAEVVNGTGLGDVVNQYFGGFVLKTITSADFKIRSLPLVGTPVYIKVFDKLNTKDIIFGNDFNKINNAASMALDKVLKINFNTNSASNFAEIIDISLSFAKKSELLKNKKVIKEIEKIKSNNGNASMVMLGQAVFSDVNFKGATKYAISDNCARLL